MKWILITLLICFSNFSFASYHDYRWTYDKDMISEFIDERKDFLLRNIQPIYFNGLKYRKYINHVSKKNNVPKEFFALAAIESAYDKKAKSSAGAIGMWQIMKPTAKDMGLNTNKRNDERKNWKKSTVAATKYIKHLAVDFFDGDYELAILAYNAGVGNVRKSIKRMGNKNAWYLVKNDPNLKDESKDYLVKFIIYAYYFDYLDHKLVVERKKIKKYK